jgi:DNA-binding transcriptional regulator YdaS (Cro superfamily)
LCQEDLQQYLLTSALGFANVRAMNLDRYLSTQSLSQQEFADRLGVTQGMVWQWVRGRQRITAERALQIEKATAGLVSKHDLRPDVFGAAPKKATA